MNELRLHPRAAGYFLLQKLPLWAVLGVWLAVVVGVGEPLAARLDGAARFHLMSDVMRSGSIGFALLIAAVGFFCRLKARAYRVELRREGVALEYGVLNKSHETLLYGKIQDILVTRSILERLLGLSTVIVQNAMGMPQKIPALGADTAIQLRDSIVRHVTAQPMVARA
jgi:membrane protein YdbS with pleckstrin-like domain